MPRVADPYRRGLIGLFHAPAITPDWTPAGTVLKAPSAIGLCFESFGTSSRYDKAVSQHQNTGFTMLAHFVLRTSAGQDYTGLYNGATYQAIIYATGAKRLFFYPKNGQAVQAHSKEIEVGDIVTICVSGNGSNYYTVTTINGATEIVFGTYSGSSAYDSLHVGAKFTTTGVHRTALAAFWNRSLPFERVLALGSRPWGLFRRRPDQVFSAAPVGATTVSADGVLRWSLTSAVHADQALRWSMNALAQRDATLMWSLLQTAQRDATARWSLIAAINADATLRYSLVQAVQADAALRWSMLAAVSADVALLWDMAGATGIVSRDFAARWSMLAPVNADAAFHWSLLNAVARDQALPWSMVQAIAADAALRWSLIQAVSADADIAWSLLQAVSADAVLAWDLAASLGTVAASLSLRWSLIAAVQQSIDARWSLLASVGADADMRWDMLTSLTAELLARWNIIGRAVADAPLRWDLIAASATDLVIRWQVGEVFDLVVRKRFVSGASMRRSFVV